MNSYKTTISKAVETLKKGGIIVYPTDTVWGIGCDATNSEAIKRIYEIKRRSRSKSMIILVNSEKMIHQYVENPAHILLEEMTSSDTPTTAIFPKAIGLPDNLINADGSIAIRITSDLFCKELITQLGKPVVSTSANISNHAAPGIFSEIEDDILAKADYVSEYRREVTEKKNPSRIIRLNAQDKPERIR
ncbi:MAG: threonylcarbamoyl-AMP synthase [Chitinophagaceae bacterium]|nr:threonylcarbamoyl-AMP synthase [Chitinophagaceae bacterium]